MNEFVPLTTRELASKLRVSEATIDNWRRSGVIPSKKVGGKRIYNWPEVLAAINAESCPAQSA